VQPHRLPSQVQELAGETANRLCGAKTTLTLEHFMAPRRRCGHPSSAVVLAPIQSPPGFAVVNEVRVRMQTLLGWTPISMKTKADRWDPGAVVVGHRLSGGTDLEFEIRRGSGQFGISSVRNMLLYL
jgi:hypothetical protein